MITGHPENQIAQELIIPRLLGLAAVSLLAARLTAQPIYDLFTGGHPVESLQREVQEVVDGNFLNFAIETPEP